MASSIRQPLFWVILWGLVITILSLLPGKTLPTLALWDWVGADKLGHAAVYAIWFLLWSRWVVLTEQAHPGFWLRVGFLGMGAYGFILEVLQTSIHPDRYFEVPDIVANIIGALASYGIFIVMKKTF